MFVGRAAGAIFRAGAATTSARLEARVEKAWNRSVARAIYDFRMAVKIRFDFEKFAR